MNPLLIVSIFTLLAHLIPKMTALQCAGLNPPLLPTGTLNLSMISVPHLRIRGLLVER